MYTASIKRGRRPAELGICEPRHRHHRDSGPCGRTPRNYSAALTERLIYSERVRYLILSDIHANWEALQTVLDRAQGRYDEILCCGDLIGYGADPNRCVTGVVRM